MLFRSQQQEKRTPTKKIFRRLDCIRIIYYLCVAFKAGCSAVRLARHVRDVEVEGSNPFIPTKEREVFKKLEDLSFLYRHRHPARPPFSVPSMSVPVQLARNTMLLHIKAHFLFNIYCCRLINLSLYLKRKINHRDSADLAPLMPVPPTRP